MQNTFKNLIMRFKSKNLINYFLNENKYIKDI